MFNLIAVYYRFRRWLPDSRAVRFFNENLAVLVLLAHDRRPRGFTDLAHRLANGAFTWYRASAEAGNPVPAAFALLVICVCLVAGRRSLTDAEAAHLQDPRLRPPSTGPDE